MAEPTIHGGGTPNTCTAERHDPDEAAYLDGCRCPAAREAHRINRGRRHLRLVRVGPAHIDATGTRRRLQALGAIGYSVLDIAAGTALAPSYVGQLRNRVRPIHRATAATVRAFYSDHADRPGPSPHAVHYARRHGWLPPLWYDEDSIDDPDYTPATHETARPHKYDVDDVNVRRALAGQTANLTRAERLEAVRELRGRRLGYETIAARLGVSARQVHRDLTDLGLVLGAAEATG